MLRVALLSGLNQAAAPLKLGLKRMHWRLAPAQGRAVHAGRVLCGSNANNQSQTPDVVHDVSAHARDRWHRLRGPALTDAGFAPTNKLDTLMVISCSPAADGPLQDV